MAAAVVVHTASNLAAAVCEPMLLFVTERGLRQYYSMVQRIFCENVEQSLMWAINVSTHEWRHLPEK